MSVAEWLSWVAVAVSLTVALIWREKRKRDRKTTGRYEVVSLGYQNEAVRSPLGINVRLCFGRRHEWRSGSGEKLGPWAAFRCESALISYKEARAEEHERQCARRRAAKAQAAIRSHIATDAPGSGQSPSTARSGVSSTPPTNVTASRSTTRGDAPESAAPHDGHSLGSDDTDVMTSQQPQPMATTDTEER